MADILNIWHFIQENYQPLGFILAALGSLGVFLKWILEKRSSKEVNDRIQPTFLSLFGRYRLENMNIYERDQLGNLSGRTINDVQERDSYFKVEKLIPGFLYRIHPTRREDRLIIFLRQNPNGPRRSVAFNIVS